MTTPDRITHAMGAAYAAANAETGPGSSRHLGDALVLLARRLGDLLNGMATADDIRAAVANVDDVADAHHIAPMDVTYHARHHANAVAAYAAHPPTAAEIATDLAGVAHHAADNAHNAAERILERAEVWGHHDDGDAHSIYHCYATMYAYRALARAAEHATRLERADVIAGLADAAQNTQHEWGGDAAALALRLADTLASALTDANTPIPNMLDDAPEATA